MMRTFQKDIAVVIPARNEQQRIPACLRALAGQMPDRVTIFVVINNTTDETRNEAVRVRDETGADISLDSFTMDKGLGVGTVRRRGFDNAISRMPHLEYLLTTDADCIVAPDWIAQSVDALRESDAVCGRVELIAHEAGILADMDHKLARLEGEYRQLVQMFYADFAPGMHNIAGTHGEAAGASLGFTRRAYIAVGGIAAIACGEDRDIVRRLRIARHSVCHSSAVRVSASCRLDGRALGGMSDALRARISGTDYYVDDCLPQADWLISRCKTRKLGPWPPLVARHDRVHVSQLARNIQRLTAFRQECPSD